MAIQKQIVSVPLGGLNTKADPKGAPTGVLSQLENGVATRRTSGGIEVRKRNGFTALTKNILGSGAIASGVMGAAYYDEAVICDGLRAYSYASTLQKWVPKGRVQAVAADITRISGNEAVISTTSGASSFPLKPNVDVACQDGYACYVASAGGADTGDGDRPARVYVTDTTTGEVLWVESFPLEYRCRVLGIGSAFFIFSWVPVDNKITCRRILTSDPTTIGAAVNVATDVTSAGTFDVTTDSAGTRMWVGYRATNGGAGKLTIKSWTTGNAAGVSSSYTGVDPDLAIGFLGWTFANATGYLGVTTDLAGGGSPVEARLITFNASDGSVSGNALLEAYASTRTIRQITGYRSAAGINNVQWDVRQNDTAGHLNLIRGYTSASGGVLFDVMRSMSLASRAFNVGPRWYVVAAYQANAPYDYQRRLALLELDQDTTGINGSISVAGLLMSNDSAGYPLSRSCLPSVPKPTATTAVATGAAVLNTPPPGAASSTLHYAVTSIGLDFSGAGLGKPVVYNSVLHIPGAAHKTYDGRDVVEAGFYVDPEAPDNLSASEGGALTEGTTYQYCVTWARFDAKGRLHRSAPGPVATIDLGANDQVDGRIYTLRCTDADPKFNLNREVSKPRIELWRTRGDLPGFFLCQVFENSATVDYIDFTDKMSDASLEVGEELYTDSGELDNQKPPAAKVLQVHQGRLFCLTGDGSTWFTKESAEGFGAEFSDDLRMLVDDSGGRPVGLGSVDSTLVIFKRNRTYLVQGNGPDDLGAGSPFPAPQPLPADIGLLSANAFAVTQDGLLLQSAKGIFQLDRSLGYQAVEGTEAYGALTVSGGVGLDDRSMAVLVTSNTDPIVARTLVRDWQLGQWYSFTSAGAGLAGVAAFRWRNQVCVLQADGTVKREVVGQYFDGTSTAIDMRVELAWINFQNAVVYEARVKGDVLSGCTLAGTFSYDLDVTDTSSQTIALTTGSKIPSVFEPSRAYVESLRLLLHEDSATEGVRLTGVDLVVGLLPNPGGHSAAQYAG